MKVDVGKKHAGEIEGRISGKEKVRGERNKKRHKSILNSSIGHTTLHRSNSQKDKNLEMSQLLSSAS